MGLFSATPGYQFQDLEIAHQSSKLVVEWWNNERWTRFGFKLVASVESLEECCKEGAKLFDEEPFYFARPPGPFKRVAAFLVIGCLHPFLTFEPNIFVPNLPERMPESEYDRRIWRVRFMLQMLPQLFASLKVKINGSWSKIDWLGFPSNHYELEFMNWLKWLDSFDELEKPIKQSGQNWDEFQKKRLARMVMATSLALEASCYASYPDSPKHPLLGMTHTCFENLNFEQWEDLHFDLLPGN